jgi:hypothetical protein
LEIAPTSTGEYVKDELIQPPLKNPSQFVTGDASGGYAVEVIQRQQQAPKFLPGTHVPAGAQMIPMTETLAQEGPRTAQFHLLE